MGLSCQVVYFIRLYFADNAGQIGTIDQVAVVELERLALGVWIFIDMIYPVCIEQRSPTFYAMNFITLFQQELGKVRAILASEASD